MTIAPGRSLGRYRLEATLGRGGMAEVFRATDTKLGRAVAVKVIQPAFAAQPQFVERFLREARLVAGLEHPNILPVYDFGEEDGSPFLVMPYLEGGTLAQRMDGTPVPVPQVAPWIRQLAEALDFAHQAGVLHRDVKPANILIGKGDRPLLADFGIAKAAESATRLTATGVVVGTPVYMAPELALGKSASPQSDLYALAVLTFELLTGQPPFAGESALSLMHQHVQTPPPAPSSLVASLPPHLDLVLRDALAKEPEQRPRSCRAFADGLAAALSTGERAEIAAGVPGPWSSLAAQPTVHLRATPDRTTAASRLPSMPATAYAPVPRRLPWRTMLGIAAVAALGGVGYFLLGRSPSVAPPAGVERAGTPAGQSSALSPTDLDPKPTEVPATNRAESKPTGSASAPPPPRERPTEAEQTRAAQGVTPAVAASNSVAAPPLAALPVEPQPASAPAASLVTPIEPGDGGRAGRPRLIDPAVGLKRPTLEALATLRDEAREVLAKRPDAAQAKLVEAYAAGATAYLEHRDEDARRGLAAVLAHAPREGAFADASPLRFVRASSQSGTRILDWHVAVAYGDARHEAAALLDTQLAAHPGDADLTLARAFVRHLDGDHAAALAAAAGLYQRAPSAAAAQVQAEESMHLGRAEDALRWYRAAIDATPGAPGVLAVVAAQIAERSLGNAEEARQILADACAKGDSLACRDERASGDAGAGATQRSGLRPFPRRPLLGARRKPPG